MSSSIRLAWLAFALAPAGVAAQSASFDAPLEQLLRHDAAARAHGYAPARATDDRLGLVVYTSDAAALRRAGFAVEAVYPQFATVRVPLARVRELARVPGVGQVILGRDAEPSNDAAASMVGARALNEGQLGGQAYTGTGAIVCVIDTGIDWKHLDFRSTTDTTKSRILRLYDMTLTAQGGETLPQGLPTTYTTGVEYTQAQLNDELDGTPTGFVRSQDTHGHGTHVTGTAAGNGGSMTPRQHVGMAPTADLVVVRVSASGSSISLANIVNGITYCGEVAAVAGKPVVVNISLGGIAGPHDGSDAKSAAIASFVATPGRVVVQAATNDGGVNLHHMMTLGAGEAQDFTFTVPGYTPISGYNNFAVDLWASEGHALTATLIAPDGVTTLSSSSGYQALDTPQGYMDIDNRIDPTTGDRNIAFYVGDWLQLDQVYGTAPVTGTWTLRLSNGPDGANVVHAWMYDRQVGNAVVTFNGADGRYTVSNASPDAIAVGAYVSRWYWRASNGVLHDAAPTISRQDLRALFSSQGPSRDGRVLPDVSAPGQMVISAFSSASSPVAWRMVAGNRHMALSGTSMSSPVVAGSVALLLGVNPNLSAPQVKALLAANATVDAPVSAAGPVPNNEFGAGKLNIYQAMARLVNPASTSTLTSLQYDAPGADGYNATFSPGTNLVLKFQMPMNGRLGGVNFHTGYSNAPSGGYQMRLWQDNAGVPGAQIGSTVNVPAAGLQDLGWNYVSFGSLTDTLVSGREYFLSIAAVGSDGSFLHNAANSAGRSFTALEAPAAVRGDAAAGTHGGQGVSALGALTAASGDILVRPVITGSGAALPVELVLFEGAQRGRTASLAWMTASETNNLGWTVQQMGNGPDEWLDLGFVEGAGTSTEVHRYGFATETLLPGTYAFRLRQTDTDGTVSYSGVATVEVGVDRTLALLPAGPNPFAAQTRLLLTVPQDGAATVALYDVVGRRVSTLFDGAAVAGSAHALVVEGASLAPGTYFVRAESSGRIVQRTLVVAR